MTNRHPRETQYADGRNLEARVDLHRRFTPSGKDIWDFVWSRYAFEADDRVLEIGCGTGRFWLHRGRRGVLPLDLVLSDSSPGMLRDARAALRSAGLRPRFDLAEAEDLPYGDGSFDAVLAHFMLYHVEAPFSALEELNRVLSASGWAGIVLTGKDSMRRIFRHMSRVDPSAEVPPSDATLFDADAGRSLIRRAFRSVEEHRYAYVMEIDDADLVAAYAQSSAGVQAMDLGPDFWQAYRRSLEAEIRLAGCFKVEKSCTLFVCRR